MFGFSDFEERLLSPDGAEVAQDTRDRLTALRTRMESLVRTGLGAEDFATATAVIAATRAGEAILLDTTHLKGAPK